MLEMTLRPSDDPLELFPPENELVIRPYGVGQIIFIDSSSA